MLQIGKSLAVCVAQFALGFVIGYLFVKVMQWLFGVVAAMWISMVVIVALMAWMIAMFVPAKYLETPK